MSHIADLHNNGRCALHQTIDQARGAYFQLIAKEERAAEAAFIRQQLSRAGVRCQACGTQVVTAKCHLCGCYPVRIPDGVLGLTRSSRPGSSCGSIPSSAGAMTRASSAAGRATDERLEKLETMIREEQAQQREVLAQIAAVRSLIERELITAPPPASTSTAGEDAKAAVVKLPSFATKANAARPGSSKVTPTAAGALKKRPASSAAAAKPPLAAKGYPPHNKMPSL